MRLAGVAFDREEHSEGICAVGAVVLDDAGPVAAVSVPAPTKRFRAQESRYAERVREAAAEGSRLMTGHAR